MLQTEIGAFRHLSAEERQQACELREAGWTYPAIAQLLGVTHASIVRVVQAAHGGKPPANTYVKACLQCGELFVGSAAARYCSGRCRMASCRANHEAGSRDTRRAA